MACLCLGATAHAGILIIRSEQGLKFTDAAAITVNGKDKALSLGDKPAIGGAISKLPAATLAGILLKDSDSGVLLEYQYQSGKSEYLLPQGLPKDAPDDPAGIWKTARIAYKQAASDKTGTDIEISDFVAFLPDGITSSPHSAWTPGRCSGSVARARMFPPRWR